MWMSFMRLFFNVCHSAVWLYVIARLAHSEMLVATAAGYRDAKTMHDENFKSSVNVLYSDC